MLISSVRCSTPFAHTLEALWFAGLCSVTPRFSSALADRMAKLCDEDALTSLLRTAIQAKLATLLGVTINEFELDISSTLRSITDVYAIVDKALLSVSECLVAECEHRGFPVMLLKGVDFCSFGAQRIRMMDDVDILVRPTDVDDVRRLLANIGYVQGIVDKDNLSIIPMTNDDAARRDAGDYELLPFFKIVRLPELDAFAPLIATYLVQYNFEVVAGSVYLALEIDVHRSVGPQISVRDSWHSPRRLRLPSGVEAYGQSRADQLFLLVSRIPGQAKAGMHGLRTFFDVLDVVATWHEAIDWDRLFVLSERYHRRRTIFFALHHVSRILGTAIPREVLKEAADHAGAADLTIEWSGDFARDMLGHVEPADILLS